MNRTRFYLGLAVVTCVAFAAFFSLRLKADWPYQGVIIDPNLSTAQIEAARAEIVKVANDFNSNAHRWSGVEHAKLLVKLREVEYSLNYDSTRLHKVDWRLAELGQQMFSIRKTSMDLGLRRDSDSNRYQYEQKKVGDYLEANLPPAVQAHQAPVNWAKMGSKIAGGISYAFGLYLLGMMFSLAFAAFFTLSDKHSSAADLLVNYRLMGKTALWGPLGFFPAMFGDSTRRYQYFMSHAWKLLKHKEHTSYVRSIDQAKHFLSDKEIQQVWHEVDTELGLNAFRDVFQLVRRLGNLPGVLAPLATKAIDNVISAFTRRLARHVEPEVAELLPHVENVLRGSQSSEDLGQTLTFFKNFRWSSPERMLVPRFATVLGGALAFIFMVIPASLRAQDANSLDFSVSGYLQAVYMEGDEGFTFQRFTLKPSLASGPITFFSEGRLDGIARVDKLGFSLKLSDVWQISAGKMLVPPGYAAPPPNVAFDIWWPPGGGEPVNQLGIEMLAKQNGRSLRFGLFDRDCHLDTADRAVMVRAETSNLFDGNLTAAINGRANLEGERHQKVYIDGTFCQENICLNGGAGISRDPDESRYAYAFPYWQGNKASVFAMIETGSKQRIGLVIDAIKNLRVRIEARFEHLKYSQFVIQFQPSFSF